MIISFDHHMVDDVQAISSRQNNPSALIQTLASFLYSSSTFEGKHKTDRESMKLFLQCIEQIFSRLPPLIEQADGLICFLKDICDALGETKREALKQLQDKLDMGVLAELWQKFVSPAEYTRYRFDRTLFSDITTYCTTASDFMQNTLEVLQSTKSDLHQLQKLDAVPFSNQHDLSLETLLDIMSQAKRTLEVAQVRMLEQEPDQRHAE